MDSTCPHCGGNIPSEAKYCLCCTRIVRDFQHCLECGEPISKEAKRCPHCAQKVPTKRDLQVLGFERCITANPIGAFLSGSGLASLFRPPRFEVAEARIRLYKWSLFGLRVRQHEIRMDRVASIQHTKGIIWGGLLIETFGGSSEDIRQKGFNQDDARRMAQEIKELIAI